MINPGARDDKTVNIVGHDKILADKRLIGKGSYIE